MLVLSTEVVLLGKVDQEDDWLGGEEEQLVDDFNLFKINQLAKVQTN